MTDDTAKNSNQQQENKIPAPAPAKQPPAEPQKPSVPLTIPVEQKKVVTYDKKSLTKPNIVNTTIPPPIKK